MYDFDESGTSRSILHGSRGSEQLQSYFASDYYNTISGQNDYRLAWTLLEIHDWVRFASQDPTNTVKVLNGFAYLLSGPGTPIIYYGLEQGFNGRCAAESVHCGDLNATCANFCASHFNNDNIFKRQDMFVGGPWRLASTLAGISALGYVGRMPTAMPSPPWEQDPFLDRSSATYAQARRMTRLRNSCRPLRRGSLQTTWVGSAPGSLLAFNRNDGQHEIVVIVNPGTSFVDISTMRFYVDRGVVPVGAVFQDALYQNQTATIVAGADGNNYLAPDSGLFVGGESALIFVLQTLLGPWDATLGVHLCL